MKLAVKENLKSLKYYLEKMSKEEITSLYDEFSSLDEEVKNKKMNYKNKLEYVYEFILSGYAISISCLEDIILKKLKEIISGKHEDIPEFFIKSHFVFKTDDGYEVPEEVVTIFERENSNDIQDNKKDIMFTYYVLINGILEIDKLIELMKKSGYKITKKEIKEKLSKNDFYLKDNVIYFNKDAVNFNEDNCLLNIKNDLEYKVGTFKDAMLTIALMADNKQVEEIMDVLSSVAKKEDLEVLGSIIFSVLLLNENFEETVLEILKDFKVKLSKKREEELFDLLNDICYILPSWSLNGYSPMELDVECDCESCDCNGDCDCEECHCGDDGDTFKYLDRKDKIEACINVYLMINGIIEIDKLVEIINKYYDLDTTKKEIIKIAKDATEISIIDNYLAILDFDKEVFLYLLMLKNKKDYYIVENFDEVFEETFSLDEIIQNILKEYNFDGDTFAQIMMAVNLGQFSEEFIFVIAKENKINISIKRQMQLYKEIKPYLKKYRTWNLNGFKQSEINNNESKNKIGRNDSCPCGSGKKYKNCCLRG